MRLREAFAAALAFAADGLTEPGSITSAPGRRCRSVPGRRGTACLIVVGASGSLTSRRSRNTFSPPASPNLASQPREEVRVGHFVAAAVAEDRADEGEAGDRVGERGTCGRPALGGSVFS